MLTLERRPYTSREFLYQPRRAPLERNRQRRHPHRGLPRQRCRSSAPRSPTRRSAWASRRRATATRRPGQIDVIGDIIESANLVIRHPRTASVVLGGGTPKNFINQASVQAEFYDDRVGGHRYARPDRDRRAAFRRRVRLEPRRGAQLGQAGDGRRAGHRSRRRHDRAAAARSARSATQRDRRRAAHADVRSTCRVPTMAADGRPFPARALRGP